MMKLQPVFMKGCGHKCVEEFEYLMALTGWSQSTLMVVFFTFLFFLLLLIVWVLYQFRPKRFRFRSRYKRPYKGSNSTRTPK